MSNTDSSALGPGETVELVESKASSAQSFEDLARDAARSFDGLTLTRWQSELRLAEASFRARGAPEVGSRLKFFLIEFLSRSSSLSFNAFLTAATAAVEEHPFPDLAQLDQRQAVTACLALLEVRELRIEAFSFRRIAADE
jgi:hypothetical protein